MDQKNKENFKYHLKAKNTITMCYSSIREVIKYKNKRLFTSKKGRNTYSLIYLTYSTVF